MSILAEWAYAIDCISVHSCLTMVYEKHLKIFIRLTLKQLVVCPYESLRCSSIRLVNVNPDHRPYSTDPNHTKPTKLSNPSNLAPTKISRDDHMRKLGGYCERRQNLGCNRCTTSHCISTDDGPLSRPTFVTTGISTKRDIPTGHQLQFTANQRL